VTRRPKIAAMGGAPCFMRVGGSMRSKLPFAVPDRSTRWQSICSVCPARSQEVERIDSHAASASRCVRNRTPATNLPRVLSEDMGANLFRR
jgi:hypothetical protein